MRWSSKYKSALPDSAFAYVKGDVRKLPIRDANGRLSLPHVRNALARLSQTDLPNELVRTRIRRKLERLLPRKNPFEWATTTKDGKRPLGVIGNQEDIEWFGIVVWVRPQDFLNAATPLPEPRDKSLGYLQTQWQDAGLVATPTLTLDRREKGREGYCVVGHEGRHRAITAKKNGAALIPVCLMVLGVRAHALSVKDIESMWILEAQETGKITSFPFFLFWKKGRLYSFSRPGNWMSSKRDTDLAGLLRLTPEQISQAERILGRQGLPVVANPAKTRSRQVSRSVQEADLRWVFEEERKRFAKRFPHVSKARLRILDVQSMPGSAGGFRDVAMCDTDTMTVWFARRACGWSLERLIGIVDHELGHLADGDESTGAEARADAIAKLVTGCAIRYDSDHVQNVVRGAFKRPAHLHQ